jgi:hypothetical protein
MRRLLKFVFIYSKLSVISKNHNHANSSVHQHHYLRIKNRRYNTASHTSHHSRIPPTSKKSSSKPHDDVSTPHNRTRPPRLPHSKIPPHVLPQPPQPRILLPPPHFRTLLRRYLLTHPPANSFSGHRHPFRIWCQTWFGMYDPFVFLSCSSFRKSDDI